MLSVAEALDRVLAPLTAIGHEQVSLGEAHGRVLAVDVVSRLSHPPAPVSAMDGYAVRAADIAGPPVDLAVAGESRAGARFDGVVDAGRAVRIFTGAVVPEGADAIVIQEDTERNGDSVRVLEGVAAGTFIRDAGLDIREGDVLVHAGRRLTARDLGVIASGNHAEVTVYRRPRIAILATGDELVMPGGEIGPDQIVSSNSVALAGFVTALGGAPVSLGIARDTAESLKERLSGLGDADMLVTIGGASVGDYDLVASTLGSEGLKLDFHKVAMRPGKPLISGTFGGVPMLGLPGNPVSVGVTSCLFLTPAVGVLSGVGPVGPEIVKARLGCNLGPNDRRQDYLRSRLERRPEGDLVAIPFDRQDSAMLAAFARADGLVLRPPHAPAAAAGSDVDVVLFPGGPTAF